MADREQRDHTQQADGDDEDRYQGLDQAEAVARGSTVPGSAAQRLRFKNQSTPPTVRQFMPLSAGSLISQHL
jgi:hypothetical protein